VVVFYNHDCRNSVARTTGKSSDTAIIADQCFINNDSIGLYSSILYSSSSIVVVVVVGPSSIV